MLGGIVEYEYLNALVPGVRDENFIISIDRQANLLIELAWIEACHAKLSDKTTILVEDYDAFVARIGHINTPLGIKGNITRAVEGSGVSLPK